MRIRPALAAAALLAAFSAGALCLAPVRAALTAMTVVTCASANPCGGGANSKAGAGLYGTSQQGYGVVGKSPSSGSSSAAGVLGVDLNQLQPGTAGVKGTSYRGHAIYGVSPHGEGVFGQAAAGYGVEGLVQGNTTNQTAIAVVGYDADYSTGNIGGKFISQAGVGLYSIVEGAASSTSAALQLVTVNDADLLQTTSNKTSATLTIDNAANITTTGKITTSGSCSAGCIVSPHGSARRGVRSYAAMEAAPTLEDTGEAQVRGGAGTVTLDPAFANAIDARAGYVVIVTPEGDTRGLFVAQRSPKQFVVREIMGGRGTVPFAYRIVARAYGDRSPRLPFVTLR